MSTEENRDTARRFFEQFLNKWDFDALDEIVTADFVHHDNAATRSLEAYKDVISKGHSAFPESEFIVDDMLAEGGNVAVRWTWRGTQKGEWAGIAPTGKEVASPGISIFRFAGGRIAEVWACWDTSLLR